jgi:hypothetical protein
MRYVLIHGKVCAMKGHRAFAVPKATQWVDQIAARTELRSSWDRIDQQRATAKVISNQRR